MIEARSVAEVDPCARSAFVPLALLAAAMVVWLGSQCWFLVAERSRLTSASAAQAQPMEQARKVRAALDVLAVTTQRLANDGSTSARTVVDELSNAA